MKKGWLLNHPVSVGRMNLIQWRIANKGVLLQLSSMLIWFPKFAKLITPFRMFQALYDLHFIVGLLSFLCILMFMEWILFVKQTVFILFEFPGRKKTSSVWPQNLFKEKLFLVHFLVSPPSHFPNEISLIIIDLFRFYNISNDLVGCKKIKPIYLSISAFNNIFSFACTM